jgi:hypothetical protein
VRQGPLSSGGHVRVRTVAERKLTKPATLSGWLHPGGAASASSATLATKFRFGGAGAERSQLPRGKKLASF